MLCRVKNHKAGEYVKTPTGDCFVTGKLKKGILPEILEELLAARKRFTSFNRARLLPLVG